MQLSLPVAAKLEYGLVAGWLIAGMVVLKPRAQLVPEGFLGGRQAQIHGRGSYPGASLGLDDVRS
jgi:hypothetical protein